ncbi:MAG: 4-alpha-glucanotransferase [Pseudomonadota bacterium]
MESTTPLLAGEPHVRWLDRRRAGVLLHITSLPGKTGAGELGAEAYRFVDFLAEAGIGVWQTLPVGPTQWDHSPYSTYSAHAGNPAFVSLDPLVAKGWLKPAEIHEGPAPLTSKLDLIHLAWQRCCTHPDPAWMEDIDRFEAENAHWLDDFVLFRAFHAKYHRPWWEWPEEARDRHPPTLAAVRRELRDRIRQVVFGQYLFFRQWCELKTYANGRDVKLFGDMPIFVAHDSAEVWANRDWFFLDAEGHPTVVAGVPPDYFSETGQRWGNPLYRWDRMRADQFTFWVRRLHSQLDLYDLLRIDHFRGFEAYWEIPAEEQDAVNGAWVKVPGNELFHRLFDEFSDLPLVAEDLGVITPEVEALRDRFGLPGMKILQFAFSGDEDNPYLPRYHVENCVVYTGTHDNDTTLGWYQSLDEAGTDNVNEILGGSDDPMPWRLIHAAFESPARLAVVPMQDFLGLDGTHRMNFPGTTEGNWQWRFDWEQVEEGLAARIRHLVTATGR